MRAHQGAPTHCSSCFQWRPELRHVDFEAAYEGPVIITEPGASPIQIDDLVVCEMCLKSAGKVIGLGDATVLTADLDQARIERDNLTDELLAARAYIDQLESAIAKKPAPASRTRAKATA